MDTQTILAALGPLAPLYNDPALLQIMVDAPDRVYGLRGGRLEDVDLAFTSVAAIHEVVDALMALGDLTLGPEQSVGELRLPDGTLVTAVIPPTSPSGPVLTIRRPFPHTLTWERLLEFGALTGEALDFLKRAVGAGVGILVAGGRGSGKTTVANLLAGLIPADQQIVVVEHQHSMVVEHPHRRYLEAGERSFSALLDIAADMLPEWIIANDLRGPEAMAAMELMSSGHSGMALMHADSPEDALARLECFCLMAQSGLERSDIRLWIASALQLLLVQQRLPDGKRRITHLVELAGLEPGGYMLQPIFRYDPAQDCLVASGVRPRWERGGAA